MLLMSIVCKFATATSAIASKPVTAGERVGIEGFSFPFCLDWPAMTALVASLGGITWGPAACDDVGVSVALGTCEGVVAGSSVAGAAAGGAVALAGVAAATASASAGAAVGCFADFGGAVADSAVVVSVVVRRSTFCSGDWWRLLLLLVVVLVVVVVVLTGGFLVDGRTAWWQPG